MSTRDDVYEQRATLLRTPTSQEMAAQATSEARGSITDEKMSPQRPRSAAPPRPVCERRDGTHHCRRAACPSEGAQPLETAARKALGREEGPLAAATAGGVTTMAASTPRTKYRLPP